MSTDNSRYPHDDVALMDEVIRKHCEWLNLWCARWDEELGTEEIGHRYRATDFDRTTNRWGFRQLEGTVLNGTGETLTMVFTISDGDDGGPTTITAWYEVDLEAFYTLGGVGKPRGERAENFWGWGNAGKLKYHHIEHRGWTLRDAVREFDTDRTMWLRGGELTETPETPEEVEGSEVRDSEATLL